jgi:hypothetical protein
MSEQRFDDLSLDDLSCECNEGSRGMEVSIGPFNDHFHYIECSSCQRRTRGMWTLKEAMDQWLDNKFWVKPAP